MPVKVTAWSCRFKCGANVQTGRTRMYRHESRCFHNPERKACQTCKHKSKPFDDEPAYCEKMERSLRDTLFNNCDGWGAKEAKP